MTNTTFESNDLLAVGLKGGLVDGSPLDPIGVEEGFNLTYCPPSCYLVLHPGPSLSLFAIVNATHLAGRKRYNNQYGALATEYKYKAQQGDDDALTLKLELLTASSLMSSKLPILVAQYTLVGNARRTEHWALAVITDVKESSARAFEVLGNTDSFNFAARDINNIEDSQRYCGGVQVGEVAAEKLDDLQSWLKAIPLKKNNPQWDCQDWVMDGLRELKMDNRGIIYDNMTERYIREEMKAERNRDETGNEIITVRLKK